MCKECVRHTIEHIIRFGREIDSSDARQILTDYTSTGFKCPAMRELEQLMASGSEFHEDPEYCAQYIRDKIHTLQRTAIHAHAELNKLREQIRKEKEKS